MSNIILTWNGRPIYGSLPTTSDRPAHGRLPVSHSGPAHGDYPHPPDYEGLWPYQRKGVDWLRSRKRALLADDMGIGKSVQALRALPRRGKAIVVCPAFLRAVWREEVQKWRRDLSCYVCKPGEFELPRPDTGDIVVVSYESLPDTPRGKRQRQLFPDANLTRTTAIIDECHYAKNHKSQRGQKVRALAGQCGHVWGLTGTPLEGHPFDLWGTLSSIHLANEAFGGWQGFLDTFRAEPGEWGGYTFGDPSADVREMLSKVSLRRTKAEVLPDLPRKVYQDIPVDAPEEVTRMLDGIATTWSGTELPPFELMSAVRAELAKSRIGSLLEHVKHYEDQHVPLVVFSAHVEPIKALAGRPGWMIVTGDTPDDLREKAVILYEQGLLSGIAGTIGAMGTGLTLVRGSDVLFVDLDWTPGRNAQAEDRLVRIGQKASSVHVMRFVSNHAVDRRVLELLDQKMNLINRTVG